MAEKVIYEFKTPEGDVLEWEGPEGMDPKAVKLKFYQTIFKKPELSPKIAKQQGYKAPETPDERSTWQVAGDQAMNVVKGAMNVIPGMIHEGGNLVDAAWKGASGRSVEGVMQASDTAANVLHGVAAPFQGLATSARGLGAAIAPETINAPSRQDWEEAAQTGGATAVGAGLEGLRTVAPETMMSKAASARSVVANIPDPSFPLTKFSAATQAAKAVARPVVNAGATVLEKLAKIRAGRPLVEGQSYAPETQNATFPATDDPPILDAAAARTDHVSTPPEMRTSMDYDPSAATGTPSLPRSYEVTAEQTRLARLRELRQMQQQHYANDFDNTPLMDTADSGPAMSGTLPETTAFKLEGNAPEIAGRLPQSPERVTMPPEPQVPNSATLQNYAAPTYEPPPMQPLNVERPGLNPLVDAELNRLRGMETPEQTYQRQQMRMDANAETVPAMQETPPLNVERPPAPPIPQSAPAGPPLEHPVQPLPPEHTAVMDGLFLDGKPMTSANTTLASRNAPYLLEAIPELKNVPPGEAFNARLFNGFQRIGHELNTTEVSIPRESPVPTKDAVRQLTQIEAEAASMNMNSAVRAIEKVKAFLEERPIMAWEDFIKAKRAFFDEIKLSSKSGRRSYEVFKEMSKAVSPELSELNQKYFTAKTAIELADMDPFSGVKLAAEQKARIQRLKAARKKK